jgi:hypothetical protein
MSQKDSDSDKRNHALTMRDAELNDIRNQLSRLKSSMRSVFKKEIKISKMHVARRLKNQRVKSKGTVIVLPECFGLGLKNIRLSWRIRIKQDLEGRVEELAGALDEERTKVSGENLVKISAENQPRTRRKRKWQLMSK